MSNNQPTASSVWEEWETTLQGIVKEYKTTDMSLAYFMCEVACECFDGISDSDCLQWFVEQGYFDTTEEALEYYDNN
jgi:hypothetical protein